MIFTPQRSDELLRVGYAGYIFDWDGTLADSHQANYASICDALAEHAVPITWEWFNERTGVSSAEMAVMAASESRIDLDPYQVARKRDDNYLALLSDVQHIVPVVNVLHDLHIEGLPVTLATGGREETVLRTVDALGLRKYFTAIVTRRCRTWETGADIFLTAAECLGIRANDFLVDEDSDQGVEAAERAGMDVVDVRAVQGRACRKVLVEDVSAPSVPDSDSSIRCADPVAYSIQNVSFPSGGFKTTWEKSPPNQRIRRSEGLQRGAKDAPQRGSQIEVSSLQY